MKYGAILARAERGCTGDTRTAASPMRSRKRRESRALSRNAARRARGFVRPTRSPMQKNSAGQEYRPYPDRAFSISNSRDIPHPSVLISLKDGPPVLCKAANQASPAHENISAGA